MPSKETIETLKAQELGHRQEIADKIRFVHEAFSQEGGVEHLDLNIVESMVSRILFTIGRAHGVRDSLWTMRNITEQETHDARGEENDIAPESRAAILAFVNGETDSFGEDQEAALLDLWQRHQENLR